MQALFSKKVFIIVIALFSMSLLIGCAGMERAGKERPGYLYYPSALVKADQVLDEARLAGKDKECPAEFNAAKNMVGKAYETYMACRDKEATAMAEAVTGKIKALCPAKPVVDMRPEPKPAPSPPPPPAPAPAPAPAPMPPPPPPEPVKIIPEVPFQPAPLRPGPRTTRVKEYKEYKAVLGADPVITMPGPGRLRVWIGIPDYNPNFPEHMVTATGTLPALGATAKVTPDAPNFKVEPKESACIKIHPTGSEVGFTLTPIEEGTFDVGADVQLYDSSECKGTRIPKATTTLKVKVVVDDKKEERKQVKERKKKLLDILWEAVFEFWKAILAIFFALLIFLLRKQLKKWFGFGNDN